MSRLPKMLTLLAVWTAPVSAQIVDSAVAIPMRDGVVLRAWVLKPSSDGRFPALVYRTPYGARDAAAPGSTARKAVARGYAVVVQDVRGRYGSDGRFDPYRQEGHDGYDTIEWAARQSWSNGAVGTYGLSYPGAVQWLAAVESPPSLKAMVPAMTFSRPTNFWTAGGVPDLSWLAWIWFNIAPEERRRSSLPGPQKGPDVRKAWNKLGPTLLERLPISNVPELAEVAPWYLEWLRHPPNDPWWSWADLTTRYATTSAAVLNISGWHDESYGPEGAITNHLGLLASRSGAADPRSELVLGPWVHGADAIADRSPKAAAGQRIFGATAGLDYDEEILGFMDRHLRTQPDAKPAARVRAFVMGENEWRSADQWPLPGTIRQNLYLAGGQSAARGQLRSTSGADGSIPMTANPDRPVRDPFPSEAGAHDYRALADREDVVVFETAPLQKPLRVVGNIAATLYVSLDAPDADIWLKIYDVALDGTAWNLMSPGLDVVRLSTRPDAKPIVPDRPIPVRFDNLLTGNLFKVGHRIRIVVMPSFMPAFSRNLQTGLRETESAERRPARISVHFGTRYPSMLSLPVIP